MKEHSTCVYELSSQLLLANKLILLYSIGDNSHKLGPLDLTTGVKEPTVEKWCR